MMSGYTKEPWFLGGAKVDWSAERDDWDDDVPSVVSTSTQPISAEGRDEPIALVVQPDYDSYRSGDKELSANAARIVACVNAMAGIDDPMAVMAILRDGLTLISDARIPDQPEASAGDELAWAQSHVARLRGNARALLSRMGGA